MTDRQRLIEDLFADALELAPEARDDLLRTRSAGDEALYDEVSSLLGYADTEGSLRATVDGALRTFAEPHAGKRLGPYRLGELLGQGGMGAVYLARRDDARFERVVAIKILQHALVSPNAVARFRDERHMLAALDHPGIVRLLDGGETEDGLPYLVMEHVEGKPLAEHAAALDVRGRVMLVVKLAAALQYAHQKLIIHRDVKPENVLVDGNGIPKLLDFGIAKLASADAIREAETRTGMALFTVEYASPEQARNESVSVATDVYSLGALLYELLAGHAPQQSGASALETLRAICETEPPRPSAVAPIERRRQIAGDLDNITLRALQKRPEDRYPSIAALGDDLQRFLDGFPVKARAATLAYRTRKLVSRHGGKLAVAAFVAIVLITSTVLAIRQARRADRQRHDLIVQQGWQELRNGHANRALPYLVEALGDHDDSSALRFMIAEAARPYEAERLRIPIPEGVTSVAWLPDNKRFVVCGWGGRARIYTRAGSLLETLEASSPDLQRCTIDPTGRWLGAASQDGSVYVWDLATHRCMVGSREHPLLGGAVPPENGRLIAPALFFTRSGLVTVNEDHIAIWDLPRGHVARRIATSAPTRASAVSADDRFAATASGNIIRVWDLASDAVVRELAHERPVSQLRFLRDGDLVAASSDGLRIWDLAYGDAKLLAKDIGAIEGISVPTDETWIFAAGRDGIARILDRATGTRAAHMIAPDARALEFVRTSPDGQRVLAASTEFVVWNRAGVLETTHDAAHASGTGAQARIGAVDAQFSPGGDELLLATGTEVRVVAARTTPLLATTPVRKSGLTSAVYSPTDERLLVTAGFGGVDIIDLGQARRVVAISMGAHMLWDVAVAADGRRIAAGGDGGAWLADIGGGEPQFLFGHTARVTRVAFAPDGRRLATACSDGLVRLWRSDGVGIGVFVHPQGVASIAWSHDGERIATTSRDRRIRIWDVSTFRELASIDAGSTHLLDLAFSPDDRELAVAGRAGEIDVWTIATGRRRSTMTGPAAPIVTIAWSPDGALLASAGDDGTLGIWDAHEGRLLGTRVHPCEVLQAVWNRDGSRVLAACTDGIARVWDVHQDTRSFAEARQFAEAHVPFRIVDSRLELVTDR